MLIGVLLPWVMLRPNRLAAGEAVHLGSPAWLLALAALVIAATARRSLCVVVLASAALISTFVLFGHTAERILAEQGPIARASASSGVWLFGLGAAVTLWGGAFEQRARGAPYRWLPWLWLPVVATFVLLGGLSGWSVWQEGRVEAARLTQEAAQHVRLVVTALSLALVIAGPLAVWASRNAQVAGAVLSFAGAVQALPSLALLGLLIAPLAALANAFPALRELGVAGIGVAPALVALTLYALLPLLRNGVTALRGVDPAVLDSARGMGMSDAQRFWRVQLPLALPVWLSGARQATVLLIGVTAVAALIGAGGLGVYIFRGLNSAAPDLILLGAIPATMLAFLADAAWRLLEWLLVRPARQP
ncbi:ABC-type proline/glycine betaine transport system, permease component (plasmid) [Deinococcus peraridilitoris DSM 19664]|uniref:ABC-type proline/glycine betaine transport system, permease component n=2 Tax=Deinococcus TaxID=1298 RepID=L0A8E7_DEIPD|nr:ABC-type proline/glycine betaine transport system, permease component [Deinococcus peraridilitoris DSM 19664]